MKDLKPRTKAPECVEAYDYEDDLNYRDDGDQLAVPSYNDVYKGYAMDPYQFQQWASSHGARRLTRRAVREVVNAPANIDELADYVLMLWDRMDGTLQDFFDAFTVRYGNNLKRALADAIRERGYAVYPLLLDDRAFYATRLRRLMRLAAHEDPTKKLRLCARAFVDSEGLQLCLGEVDDMNEMGLKVTAQQVLDLVDYYATIFPQDYALALTKDYMNGERLKVGFEHLQDYNLTDESLSAMERMLSGNQDPYYPVHNGGGGLGWDYITDMRGFDGARPEQFELPAPTVGSAVKKNG